jgi:hypothetical protein
VVVVVVVAMAVVSDGANVHAVGNCRDILRNSCRRTSVLFVKNCFVFNSPLLFFFVFVFLSRRETTFQPGFLFFFKFIFTTLPRRSKK